MTFPYSDVFSASGSVNRAILLSERTQLIAIKAMQTAEIRENWDEMTDLSWDDLEDYIGSALEEILTVQEAGMTANYQEVERTTTQAVPANTLTKISFANPSGLPDGDVNVPIFTGGICTVTARAYVGAGSAGLQYARLLHNGSVIAKDDNRSNSTLQYFELTHVLEVDDGDTFSVEVFALNGTTVQASEFTPKISMVIIEAAP